MPEADTASHVPNVYVWVQLEVTPVTKLAHDLETSSEQSALLCNPYCS